MLLARPRLRPDECLVSFLVKVSEINGFNHVGNLLKHGGFAWKNNRIPVNHILSGEFNLDRYLSTLNLFANESSLRPICNSFRTRIDTRFLLAKYPKVCPECIDEIGYCKYHWCVLPVLACTRHNKMLIDSDRATGDRLSWYRKRLNRFDGADDNMEYAPCIAQPASIEISLFVESQIFQRPIPVTTPAILNGLGLREALSLIHFFAHYKARISDAKFQPTMLKNSNLAQHYERVWLDLKNWPHSFHCLLDEYVDSPMSKRGVSGVNKHYRDLYRRLHNQQGNLGIARLKKEFDQYIEKSWPGSLVTNRFTRIQLTSNRNFISKKETARILGCDLERVSRLVQQERLVPIISNGKAHYQKEQVDKLANLYTSNWTMEEACEDLQLNRQQLKILLVDKIFNILQKPNSLNRDWVIDKIHCRLVIASLKSKASSTKCSTKSYTLRGVLRRGYSISELVRAMQDGAVGYSLKINSDRPESFKQFMDYREAVETLLRKS